MLVVNPAASHALARAAYRVGVPMWAGAVVDEPRETGQPGEPEPAGGDRPAAR